MKQRYSRLWLVVCGLILLIPPSASAAPGLKPAISGGYYHTLALQPRRLPLGLGLKQLWSVGLGDTTNRNTPTRVGTGFVSVAAGHYHSLGLKADGTLWAWGRNNFGQLGLGDTDNRNIPVKVEEDAWPWVAVAAGAYHTLALKADSSLRAWGYNNSGQLGLGNNNDQHAPVFVGAGYVAVAAGGYHSLGLYNNGDIYSWGYNGYGQLGLGHLNDRNSPTLVDTWFRAITRGLLS